MLNDLNINLLDNSNFENNLTELIQFKRDIVSLKVNNTDNSKDKIKKFYNKINQKDSNAEHIINDLLNINLESEIVNITEIYLNLLLEIKDYYFLIKFFIIIDKIYLDFYPEFVNNLNNIFESNCNTEKIKFIYFLLFIIELLGYDVTKINNNFIHQIKIFKNGVKRVNIKHKEKFNEALMNINFFTVILNKFFIINNNDLTEIIKNIRVYYELKSVYIQLYNIFISYIRKIEENFNNINLELKSDYLTDNNKNNYNINLFNKYIIFYEKINIFLICFNNINPAFGFKDEIINSNNNTIDIDNYIKMKEYYTKDFNVPLLKHNFSDDSKYNYYNQNINYLLKLIDDNININYLKEKLNPEFYDSINNIKMINNNQELNNIIKIIQSYSKINKNYLTNILDTLNTQTVINIKPYCKIIFYFFRIDDNNCLIFKEFINTLIQKIANAKSIEIQTINKIQLISQLLYYGCISPKYILNMLKALLSDLNNIKLYYIRELLNSTKEYLNNNNLLHNKLKVIFKLLKDNILLIPKINFENKIEVEKVLAYFEFNTIKEEIKQENIYIIYLKHIFSNINDDNINNVYNQFIKLPVSNIKNQIINYFVSYIKYSTKSEIKLFCSFLEKIKNSYFEIIVYLVDNSVEIILESLDYIESNNISVDKFELNNRTNFISECCNSKFITINDMLNFLYVIIEFEEEYYYEINPEFNPKYKNDYNILLVCNIISDIYTLFDNKNELFLFLIYFQLYIIRKEYIELNTEIICINLFNKIIGHNYKFITDIKIFNNLFFDISLFDQNKSKYNNIKDILLHYSNNNNKVISNELNCTNKDNDNDENDIVNNNIIAENINLELENFENEINEMTEIEKNIKETIKKNNTKQVNLKNRTTVEVNGIKIVSGFKKKSKEKKKKYKVIQI